jgi:hypothetical protein
VPDRLFVSCLEGMDVNISPAPAALAKRASKAFSSASVMFSRWQPPVGFGLSALIPPWANSMCARFTVLNETPIASAIAGCVALAQQHYLDALALRLRDFPPQCRSQSPDLFLAALDSGGGGSCSIRRRCCAPRVGRVRYCPNTAARSASERRRR